MKPNLQIGSEITIVGKFDERKSCVTATNIILSKIEENKIESIYHLTNKITNKNLTKIITKALDFNIELDDLIPDYLSLRYNFINKTDAVKKSIVQLVYKT